MEFVRFFEVYDPKARNYLPRRKTKHAAGYDFLMPETVSIPPQESVKISTGIRAAMPEDEVLLLFIRSSMAMKFNLALTNAVGVIDSDYYGNPDNGGEIMAQIMNFGDETVTIPEGRAFMQGIFTKYQTVDNEQEVKTKRLGGIGSTDKR